MGRPGCVFPISHIFGDVLTEVQGYAQARRVIWLGFLCNVLTVVAIWIGQVLPPVPFWDGQATYERILGYTVLRLTVIRFAVQGKTHNRPLPASSTHDL